MISFIVIGRNEALFLEDCLKSIENVISYNKFNNSEILYIDSSSIDNSVDIALSFQKIKVFQISKNYNAAIARNIGFKESKGEILVFVDGDMEVQPPFFEKIIKNNKLIYPFISGQFINHYYDENNTFLYKKAYHNEVINNDKFQYTTGGLFAIERKLWESVNGMRTEFRRSQDIDLGLRLAKKGVLLLRKKEIMANHHTISYFDKSRIFKDILNGNSLFRGLIYKRNLFNKYTIKRFIKSDSTILIYILSILICFFLKNIIFIIIYLIFVLFASIYKYKKNLSFTKLIYIIAKDHIVLYSFLFFSPNKNSDFKYIQVI